MPQKAAVRMKLLLSNNLISKILEELQFNLYFFELSAKSFKGLWSYTCTPICCTGFEFYFSWSGFTDKQGLGLITTEALIWWTKHWEQNLCVMKVLFVHWFYKLMVIADERERLEGTKKWPIEGLVLSIWEHRIFDMDPSRSCKERKGSHKCFKTTETKLLTFAPWGVLYSSSLV